MDNGFQHICLNARIVKNETALTAQAPEHEILCRKEDEERIISAIKPIAHGNKCENLFVHGPAGSGKTTMIKHVMHQLKDYNRKVLCLYVNCWYHSTSMAIYTKIADALGEPVSRRGRATDEIFDRIVELMKYSKTPVMLVLDEIDGLMCRDDTRILHNITSISPEEAAFGIIGISNDRNILSRVHTKTRDRLRFTPFEIKGYVKDQLFDLLKIRADEGLFEGSYEDEILNRIAGLAYGSNGNGKFALELLWKSAKHAESKGSSIISLEDVDEIYDLINVNEPALRDEELIIVDILKSGQKTSSELYWLFQKKLWISRRQISNYVVSLERKGVIETRLIRKGNNPGFKLIKLKDGGV
ncbi:AAA family ATPase [Candidatus Micrarchaeota archaeon]|nr:AAA family ATPase [Candidatus Micrarchaeota archaeon]MBU1165501.1 AAA family ATPase [Candidatus Micrarchaeota archaeon]MBU1886339.1 AAA family ATPase [Candidatus Micrarchaeota archaeon]